jgi:hypothetical protein
MRRLAHKLKKTIKPCIDVVEVVRPEIVKFWRDEDEEAVLGVATVILRVNPIEGLNGESSWSDIEGKERGILKQLEFQILDELDRSDDFESDLEGFVPDWRENGKIEWTKQKKFRMTGNPIETEVRVKYRESID